MFHLEHIFGILSIFCIIVLNTSNQMRYWFWEEGNMRNLCVKKGLIVGIIVLFIGIAPISNHNNHNMVIILTVSP